MKNARGASVLVYSTDPQAMRRAEEAAAQTAAEVQPKKDGVVRVSLSTKGRKGKGVTVIDGVPLPDDELAVYGKQLKAACASGGTTKDGIIEIQGDHRERVIALLQVRGWPVKRSGG